MTEVTVSTGVSTSRQADHEVPVYTAADMLSDPHYLAREMIERHVSRAGIDTPMLGVVPKFSRTPGSITDVGPRLGEHTHLHVR